MEAPINMKETLMVKPIMDKGLLEDVEVEPLAGDGGFESRMAFNALDTHRTKSLVLR